MIAAADILHGRGPKLWQYPREVVAKFIASLTNREAEFLRHRWEVWARPDQIYEPTDVDPSRGAVIKALVPGRGWGKTRYLSEAARKIAGNPRKYFGHSNREKWRMVIVGRTAADVRGTMLYGPSGIMSVGPESERPKHYPSQCMLVWPSGVRALTFSAVKPDQLRGPTFAYALCDEVGAWPQPRDPNNDPFEMIKFGCREPAMYQPEILVATTPRPTRILKKLFEQASSGKTNVTLVRGSTFDNAENLTEATIAEARALAKTRLGRQEAFGELLTDNPNSLWPDFAFTPADVDPEDLRAGESWEESVRRQLNLEIVYVAVDPAVGSKRGPDAACETGVVVVGRTRNKFFVLEDCSVTQGELSDAAFAVEWARAAVMAYHRWRADCVYGERNNGGALVEVNLRAYVQHSPDAPAVQYQSVWASDGLRARAQPIALLYQRGLVEHVGTRRCLSDHVYDPDATLWRPTWVVEPPLALEQQARDYDPRLPKDRQVGLVDRLDAAIWGLTALGDDFASRGRDQPWTNLTESVWGDDG